MKLLGTIARVCLVTATSAIGAGLGVQVFFANTPWLLQRQGGFYLVDAVPYAAIGGGVGAAAGEAIVIGAGALTLSSRKARERRLRLRQLLASEAVAQSLSIDQFAVLQSTLETAEKENL